MANYLNMSIHRCIVTICAWILLGICPAQLKAISENTEKGKSALRSGNYAEAERYFESALKKGEDMEQSRSGLLQVLITNGRYREAVKRLEEFLSASDNSAAVHLEGGRIHAALGNYSEAERLLRQSLSLASGQSAARMEAIRALAELLEYQGRKGEARRLWNDLIDAYRSGIVRDSRSLGAVAIAAWRQGFFDDAKDMFLDATDLSLGEVPLGNIVDFGYLFLEKYNVTEAMVSFKDCLKINDSYADALVGMARAKKYDNDLEVEVYSRAALKTNPNLVAARNLLAELALEAEYYDAAFEEIKAALEVNPSSLESLSLLAVYHFIRGDARGFSETEKKVLSLNPSYGRFYYVLAENLVSKRKYQEAVDFSRQAIALDRELWAAYMTLGMNLTRVGDLKAGREAIEAAFEGDPYNVWAVNSLDLLDQMDSFVQSESENFRYRMSKEDASVLSPFASGLAEEVYAKLTDRYRFRPEGPLYIELFPDHEGFAVRTLGLPGLGGALGVCFGKVIAMDSPRAREAGAFNWGTTLWHEFAHVITLQMTNHNIPRWFSEGLSVFEEYRARPGWGDGLDLSFIKAYKEGKLLKASELNKGFTRPQSPGQIVLAYLQAALVCEWMEQKYGFESIRQSLLLFAENRPAEEVFLQTTGLSAAEMDTEYARYVDSLAKNIAARINFDDSGTAPRSLNTKLDRNALEQILKDRPDDFFANLQLGTLLLKEKSSSVFLTQLESIRAFLNSAIVFFKPGCTMPGAISHRGSNTNPRS